MPTDRAVQTAVQLAGLVLLLTAWASPGLAESPLSAIDWLSQSVTTPAGTHVPPPG